MSPYICNIRVKRVVLCQKSPTNCGIHLTESIFKTRSSKETADPVGYGSFSFVYCSVSQFLIFILFLHMRR